MKIHIVQKGDTLWEIAQQYGVDFNELQQVNSQLSSPDMIMPGMKIKIPSSSKQVKEKQHVKETKKGKKETQKPISPKPLSVKEDDHTKHKEVKKEMPKLEQQQMPQMPQMPSVPPMMEMPKMEKPKKTPAPKHELPKEKPVKEKVPPKQEMPEMPPQHYYPMPMVPVCCHMAHSCCCCNHHNHHQMPMMHHMGAGNCHGTDHMNHMPMQPQMTAPCHEQTYAPMMPAQSAYEGHKQGMYDYSHAQGEHVAQYQHGNEHQAPNQIQTSQPYPPFYRSTPENPPNPSPPEFPAMSAHGAGEVDPNSQ